MPLLRLRNARPPEGGLGSRANSLLTDSCDRLLISVNRIYQRPIHNSQLPLCAIGTSSHRPLDLFTLILPTILLWAQFSKKVSYCCSRISRVMCPCFLFTFNIHFELPLFTPVRLSPATTPCILCPSQGPHMQISVFPPDTPNAQTLEAWRGR